MAASPFAAEGTEALSPRPPPKRRAEGTPSPATWWSARAGLFPGPLPGPPPGPGVSHPVIGPCGKQMVRWLVLDSRVVVCTAAVSLCRPPCYPVQDRSLDGAGPLPAWHQPSANEFIPPAGAVLCHLLPLCVISRASLRKLSSLVSHTAGGEEAAARVCKDARSDASIRVSVGLEPPPPEPAGGRTHRHFYTGDPPSSSARAGERHCPPARTVQARAPARRPHRPGPGSDVVLPPGRCKPQVTRIAGRRRRTRRPH